MAKSHVTYLQRFIIYGNVCLVYFLTNIYIYIHAIHNVLIIDSQQAACLWVFSSYSERSAVHYENPVICCPSGSKR